MTLRRLLAACVLAGSLGAGGGLVVAEDAVQRRPASTTANPKADEETVAIAPAARLFVETIDFHGNEVASPDLWRLEFRGFSTTPARRWVLCVSRAGEVPARLTKAVIRTVLTSSRLRRPKSRAGFPSFTDTLGCRFTALFARSLPGAEPDARGLFDVTASIYADSALVHSLPWIAVFDSGGVRLASSRLEVGP
jgi:hypothetical protein